jgi:hypothetical protein
MRMASLTTVNKSSTAYPGIQGLDQQVTGGVQAVWGDLIDFSSSVLKIKLIATLYFCRVLMSL